MIAILLLIVGGLLCFISIAGAVIFLVEPLYKNFMIVIKRKDDYTYYTRPEAAAILKKARKDYVAGSIGIFICGALLFLLGYYMRYGERGINSLLSNAEGEYNVIEDMTVQGNQAEGINAAQNFVDKDGTEYLYYFVIRGDSVSYRNHEINTDDWDKCLDSIDPENVILIIDGYASSKTYTTFKEYLYSKGYSVKEKE